MRDDEGVGLIELLVAMSLLLAALTMFGVAFAAMLRTSNASRAMGDGTDEVRTALAELDRQVRFGLWVREETATGCGSSCAVTVLTVDSSGGKECWTWALDTSNPLDGRLLSIHRPYGAAFAFPAVFGDPPWHVAAGGVRTDIYAATLLATGPIVRALDPTSFQRPAYFSGAAADLWIGSSDGEGTLVSLRLQMSIRNAWRGGSSYAGACS